MIMLKIRKKYLSAGLKKNKLISKVKQDYFSGLLYLTKTKMIIT